MGEFDFYGAPLQPDFRVNSTIAWQQNRSSVAALADGGFVIVWVDASQSLGPGTFTEIRAQRYDQFGVAVGAEFLVNEIITTTVGQPFVTGLAGGGFIVAWADGTNGLRTREFAADATAVAGEVGIRGVPVGTPTIAINANGDRMITWLEQFPATPTEDAHTDVRGMIFRTDGTSSALFNLGSTNEGAQGTPRVVALVNGTFMAVWHDARAINGQNLGFEVRAQRFDANGNRLGDEFTINGSSPGDQVNPHLVALPSGGFAVAWLNAVNGGGPPATVRVQQFDASGNRVGPESDLAVAANGSTYQPFIVALLDGRVAVSFGYSLNNVAQTVLVQQFDRRGMPLGETFEVAGPASPSRTEGNAAVLASGRIVAAWTDFSSEGAGGGSGGIRARILDPLTYLQGDEDDNIISAGSGGAIVEAFGGSDRIDGGDGDDKLAGGEGNDVIYGGAGRDEIYGGAGNDTLDGGVGADFLYGGDGDDHLTSSGGSGFQEFLSGGDGNDVISVANGSFSLTGDEGDDVITLTGGDSFNVVYAGSGNDVVNVSGNGTIIVAGEGGDDDITISGFSSGTISGNEGNDVIRLPAGHFTVILGTGQDRIIPTVGPGFITLSDFAAGEAGDQIDFSVYGADPFGAGGALTMTQSGGSVFVDHAATGMRYVFYGTFVENLSPFNLGVPNTLYAPRGVVLDGAFAEHPNIQHQDELVGADGDDVIRGHAGDDRLFGAGGNDFIDGGTGIDRMVGGTGNDTYIVDNAGDQVVELAGGGSDEIRTALTSYVLPEHVEHLTYTGSAASQLTGNSESNVIAGGAGNDHIDGGTGADTMHGGTGDDVFIVDDAGDVVVELAGGGYDEVRTSVSGYVLPEHVEKLIYTGAGGGEIRGNAGDNSLIGGSGDDFFRLEQGGADAASGGDGNDAFYFGGAYTSADSVDGGAGSLDQIGLQGNYGGGVTLGSMLNTELVVLVPGSDTRFGDTAGNFYDYVITADAGTIVSDNKLIIQANTLRAGEDLTFDGSASAIDFLIYGGLGTDTLTGGSGNDAFFFGQGRFGASDIVNGGAGNMDQLGLQGNFTVTFGAAQMSGLEFLVLLSASDNRFGASGGAVDYNLAMHNNNVAAGQTMVISANSLKVGEDFAFNGSAETDGRFEVYSGNGNDVITGGAGDDLIFGGGSGDTLTGGAGNDIFAYRSVADSNSTERDGIQDFNLGDRIDLSRIDANSEAGGKQDFSFVGTSAFSGVAGELRYVSQGGPIYLVQGDVNGDGVSDIEILLVMADRNQLTAGDFIGVNAAAQEPLKAGTDSGAGHLAAPDIMLVMPDFGDAGVLKLDLGDDLAMDGRGVWVHSELYDGHPIELVSLPDTLYIGTDYDLAVANPAQDLLL